ncbi:MAG TPA: hypothetical protein VD902_17175 [Symbiobacteriaceae bacterium]|nr:hypothetical protein [Symbiobacteriaceae bacterium]
MRVTTSRAFTRAGRMAPRAAFPLTLPAAAWLALVTSLAVALPVLLLAARTIK